MSGDTLKPLWANVCDKDGEPIMRIEFDDGARRRAAGEDMTDDLLARADAASSLHTFSELRGLCADLAAALREAREEVERRHGIGGELVIARRERDEARAELRGRTQNFDDACATLAKVEAERDRANALLREARDYVDEGLKAWSEEYQLPLTAQDTELRDRIDAALREKAGLCANFVTMAGNSLRCKFPAGHDGACQYGR